MRYTNANERLSSARPLGLQPDLDAGSGFTETDAYT
jgi:hypothetical protein